MRLLACLAVFVICSHTVSAAVVTTQAASTGSINNFMTNNAASTGGTGNVNLPATVSLDSNVAPADPFVDNLSTVTVNTIDSFNGLDVNTWTWTVNSATALSQITFNFTPISPTNSQMRLVQSNPAPAQWDIHETSDMSVIYRPLSTQLVAAGSYTFVFEVDARDVNVPAIQPPGAGSFTIGLVAQNPEPGSLALCGLAMSMGGGIAWRKRRKSAKSDEESDNIEETTV